MMADVASQSMSESALRGHFGVTRKFSLNKPKQFASGEGDENHRYEQGEGPDQR
jgi:hypothetical protein